MACMPFKIAISFVYSTKQIIPYAPDRITSKGINSTRTWPDFQVWVINDLQTLSVAEITTAAFSCWPTIAIPWR